MRPLGGSETERGPVSRSEAKNSASRVQLTPKPRVPRTASIPSYKPNKADEKPQQQPRSPSPPTTHTSLKTLISETLRKEKEAKEKRTTAIFETIAQQESRKADLKSRNQRIREENGKRFKLKSFKPVVAWGADERKVLGVEEEIIRKQAQADRERRRSRKTVSKTSLGLEVYHQVKSEILQVQRPLRSSSSIPSPLPQETKPIHTPDPYVQAYMHVKKRLSAQQAFTEAMLSQEAEARRILMLKQLESRGRVQLERYKNRQVHHKRKLKRRRRRRGKQWESSSVPQPSEPEDEEVKLIMGQIEEDQEREQPLEGRECRLFGIVEGESQNSKQANATQIGNEVVERRSVTPKVDVPRASVSMPDIKPMPDSLPDSRPSGTSGREADPQRSSFSESGSIGIAPETPLNREIQRKKEDIRRRLAELRSRVDRVREPAADDSYRHSIREETSEEHIGSSEAPSHEEFTESSLLEPMEQAHRAVHIPHYSDSLQDHPQEEDQPHFPGHISNIEAKQDVTPPLPLKTRIFEPLMGQGFGRETKAEMIERLRNAKEEEMRQLQMIASQFPMGDRGIEELTKNLEDRYQLLSHLLDSSESDKKPDAEASDLLTSLTPPPQPPHPKVEFVASSPSPEAEGDKSIHSPELSEIEVDERRERDKTSEISGDLRFCFTDRAAVVQAAAINEESQRQSPHSVVIERTIGSPEPAESDRFGGVCDVWRVIERSFAVDEPGRMANPPILVEDWGGSSSHSVASAEEAESGEDIEKVETVPFRPPRDDRAGLISESLLEYLIWELMRLPAMQPSITSIVDNISDQIWAKLLSELPVVLPKKPNLNIDQLLQSAFAEACKTSNELVRNLETPLERSPLDLLLILQETEVGQMILEDPFAPAVLPGRVLPWLEGEFPCGEVEQPLLRLVVEGANESLNGFRAYGTKGVPQPWSKTSRLLSASLPLTDIQKKVEKQVKDWQNLRIGQLPTADLHLPNGQIDEDQLQSKREERLAHALMTDLREKEPIWTDYEAEETQVKLDLADMVLDHIITELFQVIGS